MKSASRGRTSGAPLSSSARDDRLQGELVRLVASARPGARLSRLSRSTRLCRSSWALEDLVLDLDDGSTIPLVWKDLDREAHGSRSRAVKPPEVLEPNREIWMYERVLGELGEGPACWGSVADDSSGLHWLFLEPIPGPPLCEVGERTVWIEAAAWLGRFHARAGVRPPDSAPLLRQDEELHRWWYRRALRQAEDRLARASGPGSKDIARRRAASLEELGPAHRDAVTRVMTLEPRVLHGEFYPANILVPGPAWERHIVPVDWEMAALGPPVMDLAALGSGRWATADRVAFATAYQRAAASEGMACPGPGVLLELMEAALLLLAVQWLGWGGPGWRPPVELDTDWLREAVRCADRLSA